jgi:hypothetical protein
MVNGHLIYNTDKVTNAMATTNQCHRTLTGARMNTSGILGTSILLKTILT